MTSHAKGVTYETRYREYDLESSTVTKRQLLFVILANAMVFSIVGMAVCGNPFASPSAPPTSSPSTPPVTPATPPNTQEGDSAPEPKAEEPRLAFPLTRTRTSQYYGVAVDTPDGWTAKHDSYQGVPYQITVSDPAHIVWIVITTRDPEFQKRHDLVTAEDEVNRWLRDVVGTRDRSLLTRPTVTAIQGYSACTVTYVTPSNGKWHRFTAVRKGNLIYCISGVNSDPLYQGEAEAILSSFRFVGG